VPWDYIPFGRLRANDFVYFDPPIYGHHDANYDQIDHKQLIDIIFKAKFRWVLTHAPNAWISNHLRNYKHVVLDKKLHLWKNSI
jgi:hypothetical protein